MTTEKCYSRDDESFGYESLGDLIDDLDCDGEALVGRTYWEADKRDLEARDVLDIDGILERMDERLYEEVGETADNDCTSVSDAAKAELHELLEQWLNKHVALSRYWLIVSKTREMKLTAEDIGGTHASTPQDAAP